MLHRFRGHLKLEKNNEDIPTDINTNHLTIDYENPDLKINQLHYIDQIYSKYKLQNVDFLHFVCMHDNYYVYQKDLVSVYLHGGLGNQLFQLNVAWWYACKYNKTCCIALNYVQEKNPHSKIDYNNTIFKHFPLINLFPSEYKLFKEEEDQFSTFVMWPFIQKSSVLFKGYFQSCSYLNNEFCQLLHINKTNPSKNENWIHVRRGDFLQNPKHNVKLNVYYLELLRQYPHTNFSVFSDDMKWCSTNVIFQQNCKFDIESQTELDCFYLMIAHNGILCCSNSTFCFWASYLSKSNNIVLPNKWLNNHWKTQFEIKDRCTIQIINTPNFLNIYSNIGLFLESLLPFGIIYLQENKQPLKYNKDNLVLFFQDLFHFDVLIIGEKPKRCELQYIKLNFVQKLSHIEHPQAFIVTRNSAKILNQKMNLNQFKNNYFLL